MAILFDWYENPKNKEQEGKELALHPRIKLNGSTTTEELSRFIQEYCSLTESDVKAVLDALSHFMGRELGEGKRVHLDGIGYFAPTLSTTEKVTPETKRKSTKVKLKGIDFLSDKKLRRQIGVVRMKPLRQWSLGEKRLPDEEVERRITDFLQTKEFITRRNVEELCGLSRTTASRQVNRLCKEGVLVNKGLQRQPVYCLGNRE